MEMLNIRVRSFISTGDRLPDPKTWKEKFTEEELRKAFENIEIEEYDSTWWKLCKVVKKAFELKGYDVTDRVIMVIKEIPTLIRLGDIVGLDYGSKFTSEDIAYEKATRYADY